MAVMSQPLRRTMQPLHRYRVGLGEILSDLAITFVTVEAPNTWTAHDRAQRLASRYRVWEIKHIVRLP